MITIACYAQLCKSPPHGFTQPLSLYKVNNLLWFTFRIYYSRLRCQFRRLTLRDCNLNFKWPSMPRSQCLIYNGTLYSFVYELVIHVFVSLNCFVRLRFLFKSHISCAQKTMEKLFENNDAIFHIFSQQVF